MDESQSQSQATTWILLATMGFAFKGIFARLIFAEGTSVLALVGLRVALAAPLFWLGARLLVRPAKTPDTATATTPALSNRQRAVALAVGSLYLASALCDFWAIEAIGAGPSRVLLFSYPAFILLLDGLQKRRLPPREQLWTLALAWPGLALVAMPGGLASFHGDVASGALFGMAAALLYAVFLLASQRVTRAMGAPRFVAWSNTGTALAFFLVLPWLATPADLPPAVGGEWSVSPASWAWVLIIAVACTVVPFFLLFEGIRRSGAARASLLSLVGPPLTLLASWLILGETLRPAQLVGAALVLSAVALQKRASRDPGPPAETAAPSSSPSRAALATVARP